MKEALQATAMRARSVVLSLVVAAGTITGMVATAAPASALPTCLGVSVWHDGFDYYERPTTAHNTGNINCVLGVGSRSYAVTHLQVALRECYGQAIAVDGIYGSQTRGAVRNVQRFHGITVDGVFGPVTNFVMFWPYYHYDDRCFMP